MSKAVIVFDMPEGIHVKDCKVDLKIYDFKRFRGYKIYDFNDKNVLKPMPDRVADLVEEDADYGYDGGYNDGYNACITELEGKS